MELLLRVEIGFWLGNLLNNLGDKIKSMSYENKENKLPIYIELAILLISFMGCITLITDNNMKWTAQYDIDLYKKEIMISILDQISD